MRRKFRQVVHLVADRLISKDEVKQLLGISSDQSAYRVIRELNHELEEQGYKTLQGKVSYAYLVSRYLPGGATDDEVSEV